MRLCGPAHAGTDRSTAARVAALLQAFDRNKLAPADLALALAEAAGPARFVAAIDLWAPLLVDETLAGTLQVRGGRLCVGWCVMTNSCLKPRRGPNAGNGPAQQVHHSSFAFVGYAHNRAPARACAPGWTARSLRGQLPPATSTLRHWTMRMAAAAARLSPLAVTRETGGPQAQRRVCVGMQLQVGLA
jgi:hypothetical protein